MKDLLIKLIIAVIIVAILCAGFVFLDNTIASAQDDYTECFDSCVSTCVGYCTPRCADKCSFMVAPPYETVPYPAPDITPYPAPVVMPFTFPAWFQVILDSIAAWLY